MRTPYHASVPIYRFRSVTIHEFGLLEEWQSKPHVAEWWEASTSYTADDLRDPRVAMRIVEADGTPFAFMQDYDIHGWEGHHFAYLPPGSRGTDQFIGDPVMLARGHGSAFIAQRMSELFAAGAPMLAVDPHPDNACAIAAYRKIGFQITGKPRDSEWGLFLPMEASRYSAARRHCFAERYRRFNRPALGFWKALRASLNPSATLHFDVADFGSW